MADQKISSRSKISSLVGNEKIPLGTSLNEATDADQLKAFARNGLAKTDVGLGSVDNTADASKPVSTDQAAADAAVLISANTHSDALVVGLWDDRGVFDASGGAYPTSANTGSGTAGAILKGDLWTISVTGTLPTGQVVEVGDTVRAKQDTPGNTQANWAILQNNIGYTAENSANKDATGGYAGLTLFKINFRNVLNTFTSFFTNSNTAARTYTFQDRNGTIADDTDISQLKPNRFVNGATINRFHGSGVNNTATTVAVSVADRLRGSPFLVNHTMTLDRIQMEITTGITGVFRMGIYSSTATGYPDALLVGGTTEQTVTAAAVYTETISIQLEPGLYYLVFTTNTGNTYRAWAPGSLSSALGYTSTMGSSEVGAYWTVTRTYATMPSTFTAGATITTGAAATPMVLVRQQ